MSDPIQLGYAGGRRTWSAAAVVAMVLGVCSGPIIVVLVNLTGVVYGLSDFGGRIAEIAGVVGVPVGLYCIWAFLRARRRRELSGMILSLIGLSAAIFWSVGLVILFGYVNSHIGVGG